MTTCRHCGAQIERNADDTAWTDDMNGACPSRPDNGAHEPGAVCKHCGRGIVKVAGVWIDPAATGDDAIWRETCDSHDTFVAEHEPEEEAP